MACPARAAARPVSPCPAHRRTPGTKGELAFDPSEEEAKSQESANGKCPHFQGIAGLRGLPSCRDICTVRPWWDRRGPIRLEM